MPYIHFTEEQKRRTNEIDLPDFLRRQGEKLLRSGQEFRMASDHSVTVRGSRWYDHADEKGGGPVPFLQKFYGLSYPEAVSKLLGGELGEVYRPAQKVEVEQKKEFVLPPVGRDMRRTYAYLLGQRKIDRNVLNRFARSRTVLSGSVSRGKGKDGRSQSLQMLGRPLLTPDELKALSKGEFIVTKTGSHPMRTRLRLFLDWGITFGEPYQAPEHSQRKVYYAGRQELEAAITARFGPLQPPAPPRPTGSRPKRGKAPKTVAEGLREQADLRKEGGE